MARRAGPSRILRARHYLHHASDIGQAAHASACSGPRRRNGPDVHHRRSDILVLIAALHSCTQLAVSGRRHVASRKEMAIELQESGLGRDGGVVALRAQRRTSSLSSSGPFLSTAVLACLVVHEVRGGRD